MNRRIVIVTAILLAAILLSLSGCSRDDPNETVFPTDNRTGEATEDSPASSSGFVIIDINRAHHYGTLEEGTADADVIITGTIVRQEIIDLSEAWGWEGPGEMYGTDSVIEVGTRIKGDAENEITVGQEGAHGWGSESGNPVFNIGEKCVLFLKRDNEGSYYLLHPNLRFIIEDNAVSSLNFVLPTGQARPPLDLQFWRVDIDKFIERIHDAAKTGLAIPEGMPVITMNLWKVMGGTNDELSIYEDGTVIYVKEWGLRMATPLRPATRSWRSEKLTDEAMTELREIITSEAFASLEGDGDYPIAIPGTEVFTSPDRRGDMTCEWHIDYLGIEKSIIASRYITPDRSISYPTMPDPLDDLYKKLKSIGENETTEAYREELPSNVVIEYPEDEDE